MAEARALRRRCDIRLEDALVSLGIAEEDVYCAIARVSGLQFVDARTIKLDPAIARLVSFEFAHQTGLLPLYDDGAGVVVATNCWRTPAELDKLTDALGGRLTRMVLVTPCTFDRMLNQLHSTELAQHAQTDLLLRSPEESARGVPEGRQKRFLAGLAAIIVLGLWAAPITTIAILVSMCAAFYVAFAIFRCWIVLQAPGSDSEEGQHEHHQDAFPADTDLPVYTILIPVYDEVEVLPTLVEAITRLDYPKAKLDVKILLEENDRETLRALRRLDVPSYCRLVVVPNGAPKGKPRACNYGLLQARGEFVVIYDAEDIPEPDQLKKALAAFHRGDSRLVCVQAKLNYFNRDQNLLTRWFTSEYSMWFDLLLPGLAKTGIPIPLGGTSNHLRVDKLRELGAWDPYNVTEDADLGVRLHKAGWKTSLIESTTYEEANSDVYNWIRQRSRWVKGYIQTFLVHMRHPRQLLRVIGTRAFLGFLFMIGGTVLALLLNPIFWGIGIAWLLTRHGLLSEIFLTPSVYLGMVAFFAGNFIFLYLGIAGCIGRGYFACAKYALLTPLYWVLMSIAAWKGLIQLFYAPSYWEKTRHGLFEGRPGKSSVQAVSLPVGRDIAPAA